MLLRGSILTYVTIYTNTFTIKTHFDDQDKSSLQLGSNALKPQIDCLTPQTNCEQLIYL